MMKVLHSIASLHQSTGGPARSVPGLVEAQRNSGIDVRLVTSRLGTTKPDYALHWRELPQLLDSGWRPDLIHDNGIWLPSNHKAASLAKGLKIPRIVSPRGMLEPWSLKHRWLKKKIAWWLYQKRDLQHAQAFHATAEQEAANIKHLGFQQPVVVVPNGVAIPDQIERQPRQARQILFLSRIHPKKGLHLLVEAWSRIRAPHWTIRIVGPDELNHRAEVQRLVNSYQLTDSFRFDEAVNDSKKWQLLSEADLFVLPTFSENFGIVVAEALAAGVPVITTTGTPWKNLEHVGCGWCVEPTVDALAEALQEAIHLTENERARLGSIGKSYIANCFGWASIAESMKKFYQSIVRSMR